jgi:hypothetical protein
MKLPRLTVAVLALFLAGLLSVLVGRDLHGDEHATSDGATDSCPDDDEGGPCGPACPCACCPGPAKVFTFSSDRSGPLLPLALARYVSASSDSVLPDVFQRVFHPPRV